MLALFNFKAFERNFPNCYDPSALEEQKINCISNFVCSILEEEWNSNYEKHSWSINFCSSDEANIVRDLLQYFMYDILLQKNLNGLNWFISCATKSKFMKWFLKSYCTENIERENQVVWNTVLSYCSRINWYSGIKTLVNNNIIFKDCIELICFYHCTSFLNLYKGEEFREDIYHFSILYGFVDGVKKTIRYETEEWASKSECEDAISSFILKFHKFVTEDTHEIEFYDCIKLFEELNIHGKFLSSELELFEDNPDFKSRIHLNRIIKGHYLLLVFLINYQPRKN
jgi:hypothetical protein